MVLLGVTMGDPNGVGPEILAKSLHGAPWRDQCKVIVFGDLHILKQASARLGYTLNVYHLANIDTFDPNREGIAVFDCGVTPPAYRPGILDPEASYCASVWIEAAASFALQGYIDGLITCPVSKEGMLKAGCPYPGHTPLLQAVTKVTDCHMSLFHDRMRIVHITAHLAMKDALAAVTAERVFRAIEAGENALLHLGFASRRIAVAGVNPHAGERGAFGDEEEVAIQPAVMRARKYGIDCTGPYSPDTVFYRMWQGEFDLVVAMYHDQGHIPFKLVAMDEGVHVTLGLPFIRTSPDHGTAFDIAGTGSARELSLNAAILLAARWICTSR